MSAPPKPRWTREDYERDAREYLASLPLEHFMESTPQALQRAATLASMELMPARRPGFCCFNELLVHGPGAEGVLRVVPDNMVVLDYPHEEEALGSWPIELAPCPIFWVLEYVSESNRRKDYVDNFEKYEARLKIPYYLIFDPENKDLRLYRHNGSRYAPVEANEAGRIALPEIEMEVGLRRGWARFWHRGELLPLPRAAAQLGEMSRRLDEERQEKERLQKENERISQEKDRVEKEKDRIAQEKELADQRADRSERDREQLTKDKDRLEQQLSDQSQAMTQLVALLRPLVEAKARQLGRQDVLDQLPGSSDGGQLTRWLAEMG